MKQNDCLFALFFLLPAFLAGCRHGSVKKQALTFTLADKSQTHIDFNNRLSESDSVNFLADQYIYIGAGTGIGDFNNDGLPDIFFAGGQVSSKLYINKGNFQFEDITEKAGLTTNVWCTGVSIADINNDGLPDIYVCVSHERDPVKRKNLLYINQGNLTFVEQAEEYGLADAGFSTQAAFFDYDKDGDLDMYLENHNVFQNQPNNIGSQNPSGNATAADKLYRNEGIPPGMHHPVFKDVSREAGIKEDGYGLGLTISDVNNDGWPDIYVANDFISNDVLWLNNRNGTFTDCISHAMHHQSYNSMGVDAADINNDGRPDIAVLDMLPETNYRKKTMFAGSNPERYDMEQKMGGYQPEFTRNMLQLNNGTRMINAVSTPFFSEIGQLAGISETDWSWSVLMADFDNDGWKDIHITNGIAKDLTNNDFLQYRNTPSGGNMFGSIPGGNSNTSNNQYALRKELDAYGSITINNYLFHNNGNCTFTDITNSAGLAIPSVSHGAVYADLDNDGDLDLVVNNMNQEAFVYRNELRQTAKDSTHHFLTILLKGDSLNTSGIGAKISLYAGGKMQWLEQQPVRGYLSSVDNRLHFGTGDVVSIDSIKIVWPDDKSQVVRHIAADQLITVRYKDAHPVTPENGPAPTPLFTDTTDSLHINFKHNESFFFDFGYQRLLPQKYSQLGPALATADVNGDGLTDFFIGGASRQSGMLYIRHADGTFAAHALIAGEKTSEDIGAAFLDADGDGDADLLVTEGSLEFGSSSTYNQPRLYLNDGHGNFTLSQDAFPPGISTIGTAVAIADYDGDGDPDIFIGGRILPDQYPLSPRSYLLQNNKGRFTDMTHQVCPALEKPGLIAGAEWADIDNDHKPDLILCGEWMPIRFFKNNGRQLEEITAATGPGNINGLWRSLKAIDIDNDGDIDFIAGNMGWNNKFHISPERPFKMYAKDFDNNGSLDLIPAYYIKNSQGSYELFPGVDRTQLAEEIPGIKKTYLLNKDFAQATMTELLGNTNSTDIIEKTCATSSSIWLENLGNGKFQWRLLPVEAQFAPVNAIIARDFDHDGHIDLLLGGNEYQADIASGRYDASYGLLLKGNGKGSFTPIGPVESGFIVDGDIKNMAVIDSRQGLFILTAINNDSLRCFKLKQ